MITPHLARRLSRTFPILSLAAFFAFGGSSKGSVVLLQPGEPVTVSGSAIPVEDQETADVFNTAINIAGTQISYVIYDSSPLVPGNHLSLDFTGTYTVNTPGDFEISFNGPVDLAAGHYFLYASLTIPSQAPGTTAIGGYVLMGFTLQQELIVNGVGAFSGATHGSYLRVSPVPESSSASLAAGAVLLVALRRQRR